jgi:hypothetical protein
MRRWTLADAVLPFKTYTWIDVDAKGFQRDDESQAMQK